MSRNAYLKKLYNITEKEYNAILKLQGGGCAVCGRKAKAGQRKLHVDHSHRTHKVRGILCWHHNAGLRKFADCPKWLESAAKYLRHPPADDVLDTSD